MQKTVFSDYDDETIFGADLHVYWKILALINAIVHLTIFFEFRLALNKNHTEGGAEISVM